MNNIRVYIACSGADGWHAADAIKDRAAGGFEAISVWYEAEVERPGEIWLQRIESALRGSDVLLVLISRDMRRPPENIARAIAIAQAADMPILPVRLREATVRLDEWPPGISLLHQAVLDAASAPLDYARQLD